MSPAGEPTVAEQFLHRGARVEGPSSGTEQAAPEAQLARIIDALPVLIAFIDADERYRFANLTCSLWLGLPRDAILGRTVREVVGESTYRLLRPHIERALAGESSSYERPLEMPGDIRRELQATCVPHRAADGRVAGFSVVAVDITERKRAEAARRESERMLRLAVEATDLGLWDYDIRSGALTWSGRLREMFGLRPEEPVSYERYVAGLYPEDRDQMIAAYRQACGPGGDGRFGREHRILLPEGGIRWVYGAGQILFDEDGQPVRAIGTVRDITERKQAEAAQRASHDRIVEILESIDDAFFALDHQWRFTYVNRHCERLWGRRRDELLGRVMWEAFPQILGSEPYRAYLKVAAERQPLRIETVAVTINRPVDLAIYPSPSGLSVYFRDISERRQGEERQKLLMAELDHRVKNTLAAIQSMVTQSAAAGHSIADFISALQGRIASMGRAHSLLTQSRWEGASLRRVVADELRPFEAPNGSHAVIDGNDMLLKPKAATAISMVVHELTTNSAKYGALSRAEGRVSVRWRIAGEADAAVLRLEWAESGGPPVAPPERRGFGTMLIERTLAYEFGGAADLDFAPEGLRCRIAVPLARVAVRRTPPAGAEDGGKPKKKAPRADLAGARVLVVEDSMLVALDVETALAAAGAEVIGPATRLDEALDLARREQLDAAVLDINLDGEPVFPVAEALLRRMVPILFSTGYDGSSMLPEAMRRIPTVQKPFSGEMLVRTLKEALAGPGPD